MVNRLTMLCCALLIVLGSGAAPANRAQRHRPAKPSTAKAWFDAKSLCLFGLGNGPMPHASGQLAAALTQGCVAAINLPDTSKVVSIQGGNYPAMGLMLIDLSDGELRARKKQNVELTNRIEQRLQVAHLEVRGQPLLLQKARMSMNLTANNAQLALERDRGGHPIMMLADASSGSLSFDISQKDVQKLLLQNAREAAGKYGLSVYTTEFHVAPETPRSIRASLYIGLKIGFVPAGMLFKSHVVIDDHMNAHIVGLTVDGDEVLGPLIVGLLRPSLAQYAGKTRPLVSFPAGKLQLRDVAVRVDDSLHLTAAFGN